MKNIANIYRFVGSLMTAQSGISISMSYLFGLSPAPQVFTKLMRQLIKYWRAKAIRVVIYIDDGIGGAGTFKNAVIISQQVKSDVEGCGFTLNKKSVWTPTQQLPWLGHILNFKQELLPSLKRK